MTLRDVHLGHYERLWWKFTGEWLRWRWTCSCGATASAFWKRDLRRSAAEHEDTY